MADLHQSHSGKESAGPTSLELGRTNLVLGAEGVRQRAITGQLLHVEGGQGGAGGVWSEAGERGQELLLSQMAELVDIFPPALLSGQESLIGLQNLLLVFLQYLCSLPPLQRVLNFGKIENLQELVHSRVLRWLFSISVEPALAV